MKLRNPLACLLLLFSCSISRAQLNPLPTPGALILPFVDPTVSFSISNFPLGAASGKIAIVIDDNQTSPGNPSSNTALTGVNFTFNTSTGVLDVAQPDWNVSSSTAAGFIKNKPSIPAVVARSTATGVAHSLNSSFQVSCTRDSQVSYSVQVAATISLVTGQSGTVLLQVSPNGTTGWVTVGDFINGNTGSLTLGLNLTNTQAGQLSGFVPAGYFVELVSSGTAANTYLTGQETLL